MAGDQRQCPTPSGPSAPTSALPSPGAAGLGKALRLPAFVAAGAVPGIVAHVVSAGMLPSARSLGLGLVAVALVGAAHRRREAGFEALTVLLVAAQVVLHVVLCLDGAPRDTAAAHAHGAVGVAAPLAGLYPDQTMLLAHLLAAGVAGWWLARGEAVVWAAARRVWNGAVRVVLVQVPVVRRPQPVPRMPLLRAQVHGGGVRPVRGPPRTRLAGSPKGSLLAR